MDRDRQREAHELNSEAVDSCSCSSAASQRYLNWIEAALPVWANLGFDAKRQRFVERLDSTGLEITDIPHRCMVQARQIYVFAHAAWLGWFPPGRQLAETALETLIRNFRDRGRFGGFAFSVDAAGRIVSPSRDAYAHAFVLLALAWMYRLTGDACLLELAEDILIYLDTAMADSVHGGLHDRVPIETPFKRQNPHMHLLEALLALELAAPERAFDRRSDAIIGLLGSRFLDRSTGFLREHFRADWQPHPNPERGAVFEPGHHFEWAWLIGEHSALRGTSSSDVANNLYESGRSFGVDTTGRILDEVHFDTRPARRSTRVWPYTEAIKAAVQRRRWGDAAAGAFADACLTTLQTTFLDKPFPSGWIDQIDDAGAPLVDYVPASTLYHLFVAATEVARDRSLRTPACQ